MVYMKFNLYGVDACDRQGPGIVWDCIVKWVNHYLHSSSVRYLEMILVAWTLFGFGWTSILMVSLGLEIDNTV